MKSSTGKNITVLAAGLLLMALTAGRVFAQAPALPNPVLVLTGLEYYQAGGKEFTRYKYRVHNLADYPEDLFAPAPELPPCGANTKSSRTWVDFFDQHGKRLSGFCALKRDGLGQLWFALEKGVLPPSWIYIEMNDRQTSITYKSNLAETTD
jgi:hypothetical protein